MRVPLTESEAIAQQTPSIVNNFSINLATVNGTGSQTANGVLLRALFKMGIPVNGKNLFPSNIKGLPTWYLIRVSEEGYTARRETEEILVAMNRATAAEDVRKLPPGGVCFYPDHLKLDQTRDDVTFYPMPVNQLVKEAGVAANLRDYVANMVYVGVLAEMLQIDMDLIKDALSFHFGGKTKPITLNWSVVESAAEWARSNLKKTDPYRVAPLAATEGKILIDGNTAAALGAVFGGVTVVAWYPITPSTSLVDGLREYLPKLRRDPDTGEATYTVVQAEDELAAIGMIIGAGWAGARAMTATSGPGISLMTEFAGLGYFAEVPCVIWDVMRVGPSTGLPTRTSQGDVLTAYFLGHGDTNHVCLLPGSVKECFEFAGSAFDLAERLQTPVFVLSDLDLGMNQWMTEPFDYPETPLDRGKVLSVEELARLNDFGRYRDVDGDGIPYRALPGTEHPFAGILARGTGHNENAEYSERAEDWEKNMARLARKFRTARRLVPKPVVDVNPNAEIGLIAYGSTDPAIVEARDLLRKEGVETSYLRVRALPFSDEVAAFVAQHRRVYVVENNRDGQVAQLIRMELPEQAPRVSSLAHTDGLPLSARWIFESVLEQEL